jgi:hypothetical protein
MGLDCFIEKALKLEFYKLSSCYKKKIRQKEIYKIFSEESNWGYVKNIDKENLKLLSNIYTTLYAEQTKGMSLRITPDIVLLSSLFLEIPNPRFEIHLDCTQNPALTYLLKSEESIELVRRGRIITIAFKRLDGPNKNNYGNLTNKVLHKSEVDIYLSKVTFYQNISKILGISFLRRVKKFLQKPDRFKRLIRLVLLVFWPITALLPFKTVSKNLRFQKLSESEFLALKIIDKNPLNNLVRKSHFDSVTYNGKAKTIGQLVSLLASLEDFEKKFLGSKEPKIIRIEDMPMHLNQSFWDNGNRYFINCVLAGFRKNVPEYESLTKYQIANEPIYSMAYYEKLKTMTHTEIEIMLKNSPICIRDKAIASGRHKMFAMIGHMALGGKYISFYVDRLS